MALDDIKLVHPARVRRKLCSGLNEPGTTRCRSCSSSLRNLQRYETEISMISKAPRDSSIMNTAPRDSSSHPEWPKRQSTYSERPTLRHQPYESSTDVHISAVGQCEAYLKIMRCNSRTSSLPALPILTVGLVAMWRAIMPNLSVEMVVAICASTGLTHAMKTVELLPPSASRRSMVSLELLQAGATFNDACQDGGEQSVQLSRTYG